VYHYSGRERFTRYGLARLMGELLGLPTDHLSPDPGPPTGAPRPYDCQLVTTKLEATGLAAPTTPLRDGLRAVLLAA
jgi:S-adenosylmethionine synthetase